MTNDELGRLVAEAYAAYWMKTPGVPFGLSDGAWEAVVTAVLKQIERAGYVITKVEAP